ncbi:hypothetical protein PLANPX_4416 [Lacipirellula parvula]|uniref:Uncharacterized protein n=1 Tax=Lacipirellula parvula TaxID=2650471 RepID=A0A5K7XDC5_9BACT|nr:hypothetical protein PLANPX_4416 [Lacipirellula parvula]
MAGYDRRAFIFVLYARILYECSVASAREIQVFCWNASSIL